MLSRILRFFAVVCGAGLLAYAARAADDRIPLATAGAAIAPIDIERARKANASLSRSERTELIKEFRGLVSMGLQDYPYDTWGGRSISDCIQSNGEPWRLRCEIIMGNSHAYYYFYPSGHNVALKRLDVRIQSTDPKVVQEVGPSLQSLFGTGEASPNGRKWRTEEDEANLFFDERTEDGITRFIWSRS